MPLLRSRRKVDEPVANANAKDGNKLNNQKNKEEGTVVQEEKNSLSSQECSPPITPKKLLQCSVCNEEFASRTVFGAHLKKHYSNVSFKCHHCGKEYEKKLFLEKHMRMEHLPKKMYTCERCNSTKRYKTKSAMRIKHKCTRISICRICKQTFKTEKLLKEHWVSHLTHICNVCGNKYESFPKLRQHWEDAHLKEVSFLCHCGKLFTEDRLLTEHQLKTHIAPFLLPASSCST